MKRAVQLPMYSHTQPFEPPAGIVQDMIDPQSGQLATATCPQTADEYFIQGTEPTQYCQLHGGQLAQSPGNSWLSHLFGKGDNPPQPAPPGAKPAQGQNPGDPSSQQTDQGEKKKGLLDKIFGIFGGSKQPADGSKPPQ
jgi:penicillin-binding protein 1B